MTCSIIRKINLWVWVAFLLTGPAWSEVVYDSLTTAQTSSIMINEIGNTVTLSGSKRFITSFSINVGVGSSHIGERNDYMLRFYLPTAPGGYPGKLLWQSPPKTNVVLTGQIQTITFDVPYIRVPNTFIYSVMQAGDGYFPLGSGPSIGSSPSYCWTNLTQNNFAGANHLKVRIEAQDRPDAVLLGWINDSSMSGLGSANHYTMNFEMELGGYWDLFGPSFNGVTEWDKGSFLQIRGADLPEAVDYLTNGVDESLWVVAESNLKGNLESNTLIKAAGIAPGYPDLYGCAISDFVLKLNNIVIDHTTPGWTYFTWDVVWEIWGFERSPDFNRDGKVDFRDFSILTSAWNSQAGQPGWNAACDIQLPADNQIDVDDLYQFCSNWLSGTSGFQEDFETGDFSRYEWQHSGNAPWTIVSNSAYQGTYAAKSGVITHNQQSNLEMEMEVEGETISFFRKVSSESSFDYLRFYIDGVQKKSWSGTIDWAQESFPVTPGSHIFKWSYTKDSSVSSGSDCAWLDQIRIE